MCNSLFVSAVQSNLNLEKVHSFDKECSAFWGSSCPLDGEVTKQHEPPPNK